MTHITVPDEPTATTFNVTTAQSVFAVTWTCFAKADIRVRVGSTELAQSDFTFTGNPGTEGGFDGATITLNTAVSSTTVVIWRDIPVARTEDFGPGPVSSRDRNTALDRLTGMVQDRERAHGESLRGIPGESLSALPAAADRAGRFLAFGVSGQPIVAAGGVTSVPVTPFAASLLDDTTAFAARETLGINQVYVTPQDFGAVGNGSTNDTAAFAAAVAHCQATGAILYVPKPAVRYMVKNLIVPRAGGPLYMVVADNAELRLGPSVAANDVLISVRANDVTIIGGIWDGAEASAVLTPGTNNVVAAASFASTPLERFNFRPREVRNGNANLVDVFGASDSHVVGGRYYNSGLNLVAFRAGNTAFGSNFDHEVTDCSIENCWGDRRMNGAGAQQGLFKFSQQGDIATARASNRVSIRNCVGYMALTTVDVGNVCAEIWSRGTAGIIDGCQFWGGFIGTSIGRDHENGRIANCTSATPFYCGHELAGVTNCEIVGCNTDGQNYADFGFSLDFQQADVPPANTLTLTGGQATGIKARGVNIIGPAPTSLNAFMGRRVVVNGPVLELSAANAVGVRIQNVEEFTVDATVDGASLSGTLGCVVVGSRRGEIVVRTSRMAAQLLQFVATTDTTVDRIAAQVFSRDGTGSAFQFVTSGGTFGSRFSLAMKGFDIQTVEDPAWSRLSPTGLGFSVLAGGFLPSGSPETIVDGGPGSVLASGNGNLYRKTGTGNTGWIAV